MINWKEQGLYNFREAQPQQGSHPGISGIGIFTAGRPALLDKALRSYIGRTHGNRRELEYVVFDDSKNREARLASLEVAQKIRRQLNVHVRFSGFEERTAYVQRLSEYSGVSREILTYGLLREKGYTLGQNRNALLLDTVGLLFFGADDDTLCVPVLPPYRTRQGPTFCLGSDPSDFWCFRDIGEAHDSARFVDDDFLEGHEQLLGLKACNVDGGELVASSGELPAPQLGNGRNRVAVTVNGLFGDCAWGSPFGLWHEPIGYLAFNGGSLERLIHSEEFYRQATLSRQLLRVTSRPLVSDVSFSMLTFWGLDNRELLPPNVPNHRGQDLIFGQVLWMCFNEVLVGHVPLALVHDPQPPRRFWPGEMSRSAAGIDSCRLMIEGLRLCELRDELISPALRLKALGQHLVCLAQLPDRALGEKLTKSLRHSNRLFANKLKERTQQMKERHSFYVADVIHYFEKVKTAEAREDYWLPLDMFSFDGSGTTARVRKAFGQYGKLLDAWPSIVEGAKALRSEGVRLSRPV